MFNPKRSRKNDLFPEIFNNNLKKNVQEMCLVFILMCKNQKNALMHMLVETDVSMILSVYSLTYVTA